MGMTTIELHEDNSGAVYLTRDGNTWSLGPVTPDMDGAFCEDAAGWANGAWEPNEQDGGQLPAELDDELVHIATWTEAGIIVHRNQWGELPGGGGAESYLGHVLIDPEAAHTFLGGLDPIEQARHAGRLISQARDAQAWLARIRNAAIAQAAQDASQVTVALRLGISESRVSQAVKAARHADLAPLAYTAYLVRGEQPGTTAVDLADSPLEGRADVLAWAEQGGMRLTDPDVFVVVAPADVQVELVNVIDHRDFAVMA